MFSLSPEIEDYIQAPLPTMYRAQQMFDQQYIENIADAVRKQVVRNEIAPRIASGATIGIGVGSRGISDIAEVVANLIIELKARGAKPFIFPAMGSHGSATAEGQIDVLAALGVTEEAMQAPVKSTLETVVVGHIGDGTAVHVDRHAHAADGIILVNRIKPHTTFRGRIGSGISKMMVVGMGNTIGAIAAHNHTLEQFLSVVEEMSACIIQKTSFLFGLGIVENAYDKTMLIEAIPPETLHKREAQLQALSVEKMGKLHLEHIDVLVIDRMGKDISGAGIDPNVTGRNNRAAADFHPPWVKKIAVLGLSEKTHGNASGLGLIDVIPRALFDVIDFDTTYANVITAGFLDGAQIPMVISTARKAVQLAVQTVPAKRPEDVSLVRIRDTLTLDNIQISASLLDEVKSHPNMILGDAVPEWAFTDEMNGT